MKCDLLLHVLNIIKRNKNVCFEFKCDVFSKFNIIYMRRLRKFKTEFTFF